MKTALLKRAKESNEKAKRNTAHSLTDEAESGLLSWKEYTANSRPRGTAILILRGRAVLNPRFPIKPRWFAPSERGDAPEGQGGVFRAERKIAGTKYSPRRFAPPTSRRGAGQGGRFAPPPSRRGAGQGGCFAPPPSRRGAHVYAFVIQRSSSKALPESQNENCCSGKATLAPKRRPDAYWPHGRERTVSGTVPRDGT